MELTFKDNLKFPLQISKFSDAFEDTTIEVKIHPMLFSIFVNFSVNYND